MSDDALYRQYLAGDPSAGDALMLKWADALTAYLYALLHNYQDAEDMMLECFWSKSRRSRKGAFAHTC